MRPLHLFAAALFLLGSALPFVSASAQKPPATGAAGANAADLATRLQRVEEQLVDLSAQLGTVESMARGGAGDPSAGGGTQSTAGMGGDESRLGQLETEVRALSAQLADIGRRLQQIEGRTGAASPEQGGQPASSYADSQTPAGRRIAAQPAEQGTGFSIGGDGTATNGTGGAEQQPPANEGFGSTATETMPTEPRPEKKKKKKSDGGFFGLFGSDEEEETPSRPARQRRPAQLGPSEGGGNGGPGRIAALSTPQAKSLYDSAYGSLMQSSYRAAADGFEQFIKRFPADPLAGSAHYWLGEAAFMNGEYRRAADSFLKGSTNYPQGEKAADSMLKLGISLKRLNENDAACSSFNELARRYPDATNVLRRAEAEKRRAGCS